MWVSVGKGGWVRVEDPDRFPGPLYARFALDDDPRRRWRVTEIYVDGRGQPIATSAARQLPLAAVEAITTDPDIRDELASRAGQPGVPLDVLASYYATTFTSRARHWVAESTRSALRRKSDRPLPPRDDPPPLSTPPGGRLTNEFLRDVARAYAAAVRDRKRPAEELARQAGPGVSPRSVQRWFYIARQRGIMDPVRPGAW